MMTLVSSAFYTKVLANIVCPWCALGLAVFWLCPWYTAIYHRTVTKPLMLLYECKVLLASSICFFPTDEWTLVLEYCKSEPEFFLCVILCVYLLYASLRLMHLTVAQILYTIISYLYRIYLLLKCLLTCFNWIQHSVWQLWYIVAFISDSCAESKGGIVYSHVVPRPPKCDVCSSDAQDHAHC